MTRKVLLLTTVGVALLALLGTGIFFLSSNSGAVADTGTVTGSEAQAQGTETQAPASTTPAYKINVPWPSGWVSQVGIDADVTEFIGDFLLTQAAVVEPRYYTVSTTGYHEGRQMLGVWETTSWDFSDTPLSSEGADMAEYASKNQAGLFAWAEGLAAGIETVYVPVAKQARVVNFNSGDAAYAVQVACHLGYGEKELATCEFVMIPKAKNQFFTIVLVSYGMAEDELWHLMTYTTFTQAK